MLPLLVGIVALQGLELWAWATEDALPARSICCDLSLDAAAAVARAHREGAGRPPAWSPSDGLLTPLAQRLFDATGSVDAFQWTVGLFSIGLTLALFDAGRALGGAAAGLLAAALAPWVPLLAFMGRRWDTQGPLAAAVAVGVAAVVRSKGLARPLPVAVALVTLGLTLILSPRPTDNLLATGTLGVVILASAARTVLTGRDPSGRRANRRAPLVALGLLALGLAVAAPHLPLTTSPEGAAYYVRQAAAGAQGAGTVGGWVGASAYATHLFWRGLTPYWAAPLWVAGVAFALRGRGRAEVLAWALVPLVVLSALPKRNYYYLSAAWPAVPLLLALGIRALPGGRWVQGAAAAALLTAGGAQHLDRAWGGTALDPFAAERSWLTGTRQWGRTFQTDDDDLDLAPGAAPWVAPAAAALSATLPADTCRCRTFIATAGDLDWDQLALPLLVGHPCVELRRTEAPKPQGTIGAAIGQKLALAHLPANQAARLEGLAPIGSVEVPGQHLVVLGPEPGRETACVRHP